jgi:hypothetical protein
MQLRELCILVTELKVMMTKSHPCRMIEQEVPTINDSDNSSSQFFVCV